MSGHTPGPWHWTNNDWWGGYSGIVGPDNEEVLFPQTSNDGDTGAAWFEEITPDDAALLIAAPSLLEALKLAEDVLSRFPYSTEMWPNGTHPQTGITQIRDAIRLAEDTTDDR